MRSYAEYNWLQSYFDNDAFWLEDVVSWDESFELLLSDYNVFFFLTSPFFVNVHFFLDSIVKMSFLDVLLFSESDEFSSSREFFDFVMWDNLSYLNTNFFFSQSLYYTDHQDFIVTVLHHAPELSLALNDYVSSYWVNAALSYVPSASFDIYSDSVNSTIDELMKYLLMFISFIWIFVFVSGDARVQRLFSTINPTMVRLESYFFSWSRDVRMQFEAAISIFFFLFLYGTMMIITFDDDQEEFLEYFEQLLLTAVFYVFFYYVVRIGVHFFSFFEASISEGRTFTFVAAQFRKDMANLFAFVMRLLILMFRFFIYETNDDVLDSYYIFSADFDDDEYFNEIFFSVFPILFFDPDNNDDRSMFLEDEIDFGADLYSLYFIFLAKLGSLMFYIPEGAGRTFLALYIGYLTLFEVLTVNRSYSEDTYLASKRN